MRPLTCVEKSLIEAIASHADLRDKEIILRDLALMTIEKEDEYGAGLYLHVEGYPRPPFKGFGTYGINALARDQDGVKVIIDLLCDSNGRPLKMDVVRVDGDRLKNADYTSLLSNIIVPYRIGTI